MAFNNCEKNGCGSSFPTEWNCGRRGQGCTNSCNDFENDNMNCSCRCRWCQERQEQNEWEEKNERRCCYQDFDDDKDYGKGKKECDKKHGQKDDDKDCDKKHDWIDKDDCCHGKKECRRGCFCIRFF